MKKISIIIMILVVTLASCKKTPEVNLKYVDVERNLVTVGMTTANIQCDYAYITTLKKAYLFYGEGMDESDFTSAEMRVVQNTLYVELMGLKSNTTYNYYYEFHNGFNSMRTALKSFKTEAGSGGVTLPTVVTAAITEISANSAKGGGEVTDDGGAEVTERGICWSTHADPTLEDSHVAAGSGTGVFIAAMSNLETNTTYHVRAYATNETGTAYGLDKEFTTLSGGGSGIPEGAINGLFTINENGDQVYFSQGNLQYQASTNTWRFAENQWDFVGDGVHGNVEENGVKCNNELISSTYDGWIDMFGWGTSGYNHGATAYQPWATSTDCSHYYAYGFSSYNLNEKTGQAEWGYNAIANGGNTENSGWRTLTSIEMDYVFNTRKGASSKIGHGIVNGVNGLILLPDACTLPEGMTFTLGNSNWANVFNLEQWTQMEANGAVFLPAAGHRYGTSIDYVGVVGYYWSSSHFTVNAADYVFFYSGNLGWGGCTRRDLGLTVRLIRNSTL